MTSAQVVETSVTNNSSFQNYSHPDDHTIQTTDTPGFKPFTMLHNLTSRNFMKDVYKLYILMCFFLHVKLTNILTGFCYNLPFTLQLLERLSLRENKIKDLPAVIGSSLLVSFSSDGNK